MSADGASKAARALRDFLDGDIEAASWLRAALRAWLAGEAEIHEALGIPSTARGTALELRNLSLREAARHMQAATPWLRARALAAEIRAFERKRAAWSRLPAPPSYATPAQCCLFRAARWGELPASPEQLFNVLHFADSLERKVEGLPVSNIPAPEKDRNALRPTLQPLARRPSTHRRKTG